VPETGRFRRRIDATRDARELSRREREMSSLDTRRVAISFVDRVPRRAHSSRVTGNYEDALHDSFGTMLREAGAYFMREGRLLETVRRLATRLAAEGVDYAVIGALALGEHGYVRMTEDVDVLLTPDGLARFRQRIVGRGYVATHPGATRSFRDPESGVRIKALVTGEYPGDGKPKAVAFPDPAVSTADADGMRVLTLARVLELKLASGLSAPHRLRHLADVQEVIKAKGLDATFAAQLDPSVRAAYLDLERAVRTAGE
jgi:hypothetical protein